MDIQDSENRSLASAQSEDGKLPNAQCITVPPRSLGKLLFFKPKAPIDEPATCRLTWQSNLPGGNAKRMLGMLVSKHAPPNWRPRVGSRVAALSEGRIVQGIVLGVKSKPWRPAAFFRKNFTGCWLLLDSGKRRVANELRPIS